MTSRALLRSLRTLAFATAASIHVGCATTGGVPAIAPGTPVEGNSFVIRDVRVFNGERTLERMNVVVRDGRIVSVGGSAPPSDLPIIIGAGRTLLPGFIDAHGHVSNETALRDALRFGVTTVLDMLTRIDAVRGLKPSRERFDRPTHADLYTAGSPVTSPGGLGTQFGIPFNTISSPAEADAHVKSRIAEGSDYIKVLYEPDAPVFTTISRETLEAVVAAAHRERVMTVVHVSSLQGARDAVRAGADGLAHGFGDSLMEASLAHEIARRGVFVTPTLSIFSAFDGRSIGPALAADARLSPYLREAQRRTLTGPTPGPDNPLAPYLVRFKVDIASENVRRMRAAGVRILAGTDAPNLGSHGASLHGELQMLMRAGLTAAEAMRAATRGPADAFKLSDRGRVTPGARADLVLVEGNPLRDITATRAIARIFKNGFEVARRIP